MKLNAVQLNSEGKKILVQDFSNGIRKKELLSKYGISRSYLNKILRQNGIKKSYNLLDRARKYSLNEKFFDSIDSEEKAYWFGFLLADGYVSSKTGNWALQLRLIDLDAITKFKKSLNSTCPIRTIHSDKRKTCYELSIASKYIVESLSKHGLVNNKTFRISIPENITEGLIPHVIRGYFDGDGCIYTRKNKYQQTSCSITSSSPKILLQIQTYLIKQKIIRNRNYISNRKNYQNFTIAKHQEVFDFLSLIYRGSSVYLDRKFDKAQKILTPIHASRTVRNPSKLMNERWKV